jgi:hypothetical protein
MVAHRVADRKDTAADPQVAPDRPGRLLVRPCGTGVMEGSGQGETERGPPQRSKPAGANNFMYYALDMAALLGQI